MDRLITAQDVARRDHMVSVEAWVRFVSGKMQKLGVTKTAWDGRTVAGEPVMAFVNHGRLLAQCDLCGKHEYVCEDPPIFFCSGCGNGIQTYARTVQFPNDWERVKAALIARPVMETIGRNDVERMFFHKPGVAGLRRDWRPGQSVAELEGENRQALDGPVQKRRKAKQTTGGAA